MGKSSRRKRQKQDAPSSTDPVKKIKKEDVDGTLFDANGSTLKKKPKAAPEKNKEKRNASNTVENPKSDNSKEGKRKKRSSSDADVAGTSTNNNGSAATSNNNNENDDNPLASKVQAFLEGIPIEEREHFFSDAHVEPERRAELWTVQADVGEELVDKYAWAIPDQGAFRILKHFAPLVEIGCGANAYWCKQMKRNGIDIVAYDSNPVNGGKIAKSKKSKGQKLQTKTGGPEVLGHSSNEGRNLFLCYPDENDNAGEEEGEEQFSLGAACLEEFQGDFVIHVGEIYGDTLSVDQAPWGRSSSPSFQERLATKFHCVLQIPLPNWIHVRDTLTVWKRSSLCSLVFGDEEEDESVEEAAYRYIPPEERLPMERAAPCVAHLLKGAKSNCSTSGALSTQKTTSSVMKESKATEPAFSSASKEKDTKKRKQTPIDKAKEKSGYRCPW